MRQSTNTLGQILQNANRYHFMQLLRLLEHANVLHSYLLQPHQTLSFPAADVLYANEIEKKITLRFMGLFGVDAPLPSYFLSEALHLSDQGEKLRAFLNIFNHRIYQLFYKAWKRAQLAISLEQGNNDHLHLLTFVSGGGFSINDKREFAAAGIMGQRIHSASGLKLILQKFLSLNVLIQQFIPRWIKIQANFYFGKNVCLGDSMLGQRVLDLSSQILITLKNLSLSQSLTLLPSQKEGRRLNALIKHFLGPYITYRLCLAIQPETTSIHVLGMSSYYLGYQSWVGILSPNSAILIYY